MKTNNKLTAMLIVAGILVGMYVSAIYTASGQEYVPAPDDAENMLITDGNQWEFLRHPATETAAAGYDWTSDNMVFYELMGNSSVVPATIEAYTDPSRGAIDLYKVFGYGVNAVEIRFFSRVDSGAHDEEDTFDFELYAFANNSNYGPALPVYTTTGTGCAVGTGLCSYQPDSGNALAYGRWVDTIAGTDCWPVGVAITDSGNNHICTITFDLMGNRYLLLRTFNSGGGASEAGEVGAIIRAY